MVTADALAARRNEIARAPDLQALLAHLTARAAPLLERLPPIPGEKAMLSVDGGRCPDDGEALSFDPWSPEAHRCPRCGRSVTGERHDRNWVRYQHLWLAERAAHLAALAALGGNAAAGARAREILTGYARTYWRYPNRDNVLGPSRLFFSTYLESLWVCNYLAAAVLLRESGGLDDGAAKGVGQVAEEAANLIGEFDEGFSNRQTWNDAALAAIAVWFEDQELAERAIEGPTGLVAHLGRGYGRDGMWYEGENYHLFALRGLLTGAAWARLAGVDLYADGPLAARLAAALLAPAHSALPDFTFPARKDSRYGTSLAAPAYLELWEIGRAHLADTAPPAAIAELESWLGALDQAPATQPALYDAYLHDAPIGGRAAPPSRRTLSWWALLEMAPEVAAAPAPWVPASLLLQSQGLAVLREGGRYASLECGQLGGGHGHPDRLHLTLHAQGVHWLPDPGTGSYVARDLFWYRSTLAHNAPRLDGTSQPSGDAQCESFDVQGEWAWVRGRFGDLTRTVVSGPSYVLDVVELAGRAERLLELSWHLGGRGDTRTPGRWEQLELEHEEFVSKPERFVPGEVGAVLVESAAAGRVLEARFAGDGELARADGPGLPGHSERTTFYLRRSRGRSARFVTVVEPVAERASVRGVRVLGGVVEVATVAGLHRHTSTAEGWEIGVGENRVRLGGARAEQPPFQPLLELDRPTRAAGAALRVADPPPLDGTLAGFDASEPLRLELEDQYRRSEEPYSGPDDFSARAYAAWDDSALYLAVDVTKANPCFRAADAPPSGLDNEPDDIHSDGLQVYLHELGRGETAGFLGVPEGGNAGRVRVRGAGTSPGDPALVEGAWRRTESGYCVTLALHWPAWLHPHVGGRLGFDLLVNEMLPGRERRVGQLVWSGGNGWVWLQGDRQDPARFGVLELVG